MKSRKIIVLGRKFLYTAVTGVFLGLLTLSVLVIHFTNSPANVFIDPKSGIIAIDAGHGGIDGGTNKNGILEKEINLAISHKLKSALTKKGYKVVMTREVDISMEGFDDSDLSRYRKDLYGRANIINRSNAQLFVSIHVNYIAKRPSADGSIVFYSSRYEQNEPLAYFVQRALNRMVVDGKKRTTRNPQKVSNLFILNHTERPGILVETGFMSNDRERKLLTEESFQTEVAEAVGEGVIQYLKGD